MVKYGDSGKKLAILFALSIYSYHKQILSEKQFHSPTKTVKPESIYNLYCYYYKQMFNNQPSILLIYTIDIF